MLVAEGPAWRGECDAQIDSSRARGSHVAQISPTGQQQPPPQPRLFSVVRAVGRTIMTSRPIGPPYPKAGTPGDRFRIFVESDRIFVVAANQLPSPLPSAITCSSALFAVLSTARRTFGTACASSTVMARRWKSGTSGTGCFKARTVHTRSRSAPTIPSTASGSSPKRKASSTCFRMTGSSC